MKKENFVTLILSTIGGILFAIGMCMCLLPEWNAFKQGVMVAAAGAVVLLAMLMVRRKMKGKPAIKINGKAVGTIALDVIGALVLGVGMCCTMVWADILFIPGIIIGLIGMIGVIAAYPVYTHVTKKQREKLAPKIMRLSDELMK